MTAAKVGAKLRQNPIQSQQTNQMTSPPRLTNFILKLVSSTLSWTSGAILLFFTFRRWFLTLIAVYSQWQARHQPPQSPPESPYSVLLLVPVRNEEQTLLGLLGALDQLEYAPEQLTIVLINDGSTDQSEAVMQAWAEHRPNCHVLSLSKNRGKAMALTMAARQFSEGELVTIYDADERPAPNALRALVAPFADPNVGAVSGRRSVSNALASGAASYTAIEGLVHQMITTQAKNWLNLAPPILGANCAYRRTALTQVGFFKPGALVEDTDLTIKLTQQGWQIRFASASLSYHTAPQTIGGYWRQHTRWVRGFNEVAREHGVSSLLTPGLPLTVRLELLVFSLGYLDRVALTTAVFYTVVHITVPRNSFHIPRLLLSIIGLSLLTPFLQILIALRLTRQPFAMWRRVLWVPIFFVVDMAMATVGLWNTIKRSPQVWEARER